MKFSYNFLLYVIFSIIYLFFLVFGIFNAFTKSYLIFTFLFFSFLNFNGLSSLFSKKSRTQVFICHSIVITILLLIILEQFHFSLILKISIFFLYVFIMMIIFYKKALKNKPRNYLLSLQILFFLLIVISIVNSGNLLHKEDFIPVHPLKFIHIGLMGLIATSLLEMLGLNNEIRKFRIIIFSTSITIICIGLFDLLINYEIYYLALICGIVGLVSLLGGFILSKIYYKKLR